jgi:hypothetical protein
MNIRQIIREELLFESLEDRLKSAFHKWCQKTYSDWDKPESDPMAKTIRRDIIDADGWVEQLDRYGVDFEDPYSELYKKTEELYDKKDYEGIHKLIAKMKCDRAVDMEQFKEWVSYRNQAKSPDIFQYKSFNELRDEISKAKEKSFTKKLKKASPGKDYKKVYEDDDMVVIIPLTHVGSCKYGQGTRWCTASKTHPQYFEGYNERGVLFRILQKNDNYLERFKGLGLHRLEKMDKVSIFKRNRKDKTSGRKYDMVNSVDDGYNEKQIESFMEALPKELVNIILTYKK